MTDDELYSQEYKEEKALHESRTLDWMLCTCVVLTWVAILIAALHWIGVW